MKYSKIYALLVSVAVSASLSGCFLTDAISNLEAFTVTQQTFDEVHEGYTAAFLVPAANYRNLGYCAAGTKSTLSQPCADRLVVTKLQNADKAVSAAFDNVQAMIKSGDNTGVSAAYQGLRDAITAAEGVAAANGVH